MFAEAPSVADRLDVKWADDEARAEAERAAAALMELGPGYADLYLRAAWLAANDRALNRKYAGADDLSELGLAAEHLCTLLHELAVEDHAIAVAPLHLVKRRAAGQAS
jgi:hypothetical protein